MIRILRKLEDWKVAYRYCEGESEEWECYYYAEVKENEKVSEQRDDFERRVHALMSERDPLPYGIQKDLLSSSNISEKYKGPLALEVCEQTLAHTKDE